MINLTKDIKKAKEVAKILYYKFNSEDGIFGHNIMPEDLKPKAIKWGSNISNTSKYEYLMFITMVVSIDYQRDANKLWEAGRKTFDDETTKWLFDPKICNSKKFQDIREAMSKYKLSKKPNQDPCIWNSVSYSFFKLYDSDPKNLVRECDFDAVRIYEKINANKNSFPFLSGDKILPLWIRMLKDNLKFDLKNIDKIKMPVDVHIARSTFATGVLKGEFQGTISIPPRHVFYLHGNREFSRIYNLCSPSPFLFNTFNLSQNITLIPFSPSI